MQREAIRECRAWYSGGGRGRGGRLDETCASGNSVRGGGIIAWLSIGDTMNGPTSI